MRMYAIVKGKNMKNANVVIWKNKIAMLRAKGKLLLEEEAELRRLEILVESAFHLEAQEFGLPTHLIPTTVCSAAG